MNTPKTKPATPREGFEICKPCHTHVMHRVQELFTGGNILQSGGVAAMGLLNMDYDKLPTVKLIAVWDNQTGQPVFTPLGFSN
jgi:hypothetical protein